MSLKRTQNSHFPIIFNFIWEVVCAWNAGVTEQTCQCISFNIAADTWPEVLDDTNARRDWGWSHEYDLQKMVKDIVAKLSRT